MQFLILLSFVVLALGFQKSYDGNKVYSIKFKTVNQLKAIQKLERYGIDFWDRLNVNEVPIRVRVPPKILDSFSERVRAFKIKSNLLISNLTEVLIKEKQENDQARSMNRKRSQFAYNYYLNSNEFKNNLLELASTYPGLINVTTAGQSYEGRDLLLVKISNTGFDGTKPVIFIDAGIHAREWAAPMSALYLINQIATQSDQFADMLKVDWMIVPLANPDGYEYSHSHDQMWRKTRSPNNGTTCIGTDGNRNFPFKWELGDPDSRDPCSETYRGDKPLNQAEVKLISDLLTSNNDKIKLYLAVHSHGQYILYPFGFDKTTIHPLDAKLHEIGNSVSHAIQKRFPNKVYRVGNAAKLLYPANGASDDYAAGVAKINLAYTVELSGGGSNGFNLPPSQIRQVASEMFIAFYEFSRNLYNYYSK